MFVIEKENANRAPPSFLKDIIDGVPEWGRLRTAMQCGSEAGAQALIDSMDALMGCTAVPYDPDAAGT